MCDNPGSPVSEMASHLQSVHRWAITGTPMSHDLRDMRGLLKFLRAEPLADVPASKLSPAGGIPAQAQMTAQAQLVGRRQPATALTVDNCCSAAQCCLPLLPNG